MRYRRIKVHGQILVSIFTKGDSVHTLCTEGLPPGAKFCYSFPDIHFGIWLVVSHDSFDLLKNGEVIPEHPNPIMMKIQCDATNQKAGKNDS